MNTNPKSRVAITAAGVVSPMGIGLAETESALRAGRDCIRRVTLFPVEGCRCQTAGEVDDAELSAALDPHRHRFPPKAGRLHRASLMVIAATLELRDNDPGFSPEEIVFGTTGGGMSFGESFHRAALAGKIPAAAAGWLANYPPTKMVVDAAVAAGYSAPIHVVANACASGTNAIGHAYSLIRSGMCRRVLCGGFDALARLIFVGFDSLQASTGEKCRPFDKDRSGLVIAEGAAAFALEEMGSARTRRAPILAEIAGYGVSTDTFHMTQPHPSGSGPLRSMRDALSDAGKAPGDIDYINAHGTATPMNDASEGARDLALFPGAMVSSTKSMMGHALGAAGAIEAAISLVGLRGQFVPPNINYRAGDPAWDFEIVSAPREADIRCALSNSFGFGGSDASVVIERFDGDE